MGILARFGERSRGGAGDLGRLVLEQVSAFERRGVGDEDQAADGREHQRDGDDHVDDMAADPFDERGAAVGDVGEQRADGAVADRVLDEGIGERRDGEDDGERQQEHPPRRLGQTVLRNHQQQDRIVP